MWSVWWLIVVLCLGVETRGEAWSSSQGPRGQQILPQGGGLLPFPEGRMPDGTLYKTDYRCEGENMTVSCIDSDGPGLNGTIQVVRGNFGRFSIAICNRHGQTSWSVNCMAPQTTKVLQRRCDGKKKCVVPVNSDLFHDACPGTHKYLEIHYACLSSNNQKVKPGGRLPPIKPGWVPVPPPPSGSSRPSVNTNITYDNIERQTNENNNKRKPILVTEKVETTSVRVPITTPRPTTSSTTTTTASTVTSTTSSTVKRTSKRPIQSTRKPTPVYPTTKDLGLPTGINTPSSTLSDVYVTPMTGAPACRPITERQLQWNWTPAGQRAIQPCPIGATGLARWYCAENPNDDYGGSWQGQTPDMSDCKSLAMTQLEAQMRQEDPENVLVSSLAYLTRTKSLFGGDLEAVVSVMRTVASRIQYRLQSSSSFHDKVNHIRQVLLNVLRSAANILEDGPNRDAWNDLSPDRQMKVATSLMLALEENAFLLAGVTDRPQDVLETYETLTMTIKVLQVSRSEETVTFPSKPLLYVDDKISLAASDLEDNSQGGRLAEAVFFSYRGLHEILSGAKTRLSFEDEQPQIESNEAQFSTSGVTGGHWRLNSRIISASLGRGRHIELQNPVTIQLRHLVTDSDIILKDPVCVFWDYEVHGWSDSGCRLIETNQTFSVCQCDHLTNFALLMRPVTTSTLLTQVKVEYVFMAVALIVVIVLLFVMYKMRSRLKSWCQSTSRGCCLASCCCLNDKARRTSHLEKCQSFYTGLSQGGPGGSLGSTPGSVSGYPQLSSVKKSRTLGGPNGILTSGLSGNNIANTTSRVPLQYMDRMNSNSFMLMSKPRAHITLNPYSTQLVDNLNMMMPQNSSNNNSTSNSSASTNSTSLGTPLTNNHQTMMSPQLMNLTNTLRTSSGIRTPTQQLPPSTIHTENVPQNGEVVYRAVSPHGHVYWEIDPNNMYGTNHNNNNNNQVLEESVALLSQPPVSRPYLTSRHGQLTEDDLLLQQHLLASNDPQVTNGLHDSFNGLQHTSETSFQPGMVMMASSSNTITPGTQSFVRTGANRFTRKQQHIPVSIQQQQHAQPQQTVATVSQASNNVPEQLQQQVQIRDIRPIQVSVKSSEYIEAKIRNTLRRSNQHHTNSDS